MRIDISMTSLCTGFRVPIVTAITLACLVVIATQAHADFGAVGDVTPANFNADNFDGGATGAIKIGINDLGGIAGDDEQVFGGVNPLESSSAVVGEMEDGIGAVTLTGFISQWDISGDLTLGDAGQAFLSMGASATVDVGGATILGAQATGQGIVEITGTVFPGARLRNTGDLTVGDLGIGIISLSTRGSLLSEANAVVGNQDGGDGSVTLTDLGTRWTVKGDLTVGNGNNSTLSTAHGLVAIANDAVLQAESTLTINPRGTVDLAGGTLRMLPQASNPIVNNGIILGDGFIDGGIEIGASGEVRNAGALVQNGSTVTRQREHLIVAEEVVNDGTIQSLGGSMDFEALVTNNLEIVARDAEMHFRAGVSNETGGVISIGGDTTIHGNIANNGGNIFVLSGSESLMVGDLTFTGNSVLGLTVGEDAGTLDVTGEISFDSTLIALDYSAGVSPQDGDTYQILKASGGISGTLDNPPSSSLDPFVVGQASAGGVLWDIINTGSSLLAQATSVLALPIGADFNGDGIVNELDLIIWENNFGRTGSAGDLASLGDADGDGDVDAADFLKIQRDFGVLPVPPISAAAVVPEPSTLVIALLSLACCPRRRRS